MRYWFGGTPSDYVISPGQQVQITNEVIGYQTVLVPGARLWLYDYTTGERTTDLLDAGGTLVDSLVADEYGAIPRFRGPDQVRRLLIGPEPADQEEGDSTQQTPAMWTITSTDWPTVVDGIGNRVTALEEGANSDTGEDTVVGSAHPLVWSLDGQAETHTSATSYWNLEGKTQTITHMRAQATVTSGSVAVHVLTIDPDTQATTVVAAALLDTTTQISVSAPDTALSESTGLTVAVELGSDADQVFDMTVQVMVR
ncbi:hypothetical protein [Nocardiopsis sp. LOL_012]|uniref:hypothetical protein n=1 Tax=Nocardiopsis sp. LOL_012 TaxID=3345409 RepID=UPI003A83F5F2